MEWWSASTLKRLETSRFNVQRFNAFYVPHPRCRIYACADSLLHQTARMDHDRLFKELLTAFFADFLDLFLPELSAYMDREAIEFLDKEVFTDVTAGAKHEADLVARARLRGQDSFFLIHLEHQAQPQ